jgi:hypothetical protein
MDTEQAIQPFSSTWMSGETRYLPIWRAMAASSSDGAAFRMFAPLR